MEGNQVNSLQWYPHAQQEVCYDRQPAPQHQNDEAFFHPLDCGPTLQIGYAHFNYIFLLNQRMYDVYETIMFSDWILGIKRIH